MGFFCITMSENELQLGEGQCVCDFRNKILRAISNDSGYQYLNLLNIRKLKIGGKMVRCGVEGCPAKISFSAVIEGGKIQEGSFSFEGGNCIRDC